MQKHEFGSIVPAAKVIAVAAIIVVVLCVGTRFRRFGGWYLAGLLRGYFFGIVAVLITFFAFGLFLFF